jgi:hypothetical protein
MVRVIAALVLVPLLYPLSILVAGGREGIAGALFVGSITVPGSLLLGVPFFVLARRRNWLHWWQFCLGGFVLGLLFASLALFLGWEVALFFAPYFSFFGATHALVFLAFRGLAQQTPNIAFNRTRVRPSFGGLGTRRLT